jgi:hypothetical protein
MSIAEGTKIRRNFMCRSFSLIEMTIYMLMKLLQEFTILVHLTINAYNISQFENPC